MCIVTSTSNSRGLLVIFAISIGLCGCGSRSLCGLVGDRDEHYGRRLIIVITVFVLVIITIIIIIW
ncbi:hypothetical protein SNK04_012525 [Fusarium graminearum]